MELSNVMGSVMPVWSPAWGSQLPRGQVSGMGTSAGWGGVQQHPHGCSAVGEGSAGRRWGWYLGSISRSLERELMGAARLNGLMSGDLWGQDCPSNLFAV